MRVTNTSMIRSYMNDVQQGLGRVDKIGRQLNSGKQINRVSDDPHKAIKIMNLNKEIKYTEKYNYNIDETVGWMDTTDTALESIGRLTSDIKELLLKAGNGTYSQEELKAINAEMNEKIKELGEVLNTTHGGRYIFGGTDVDTPPIEIIEHEDGTVELKLNNQNTEALKADISGGLSIRYNITASEIFGDGEGGSFLDVFNDISRTMNKIANGEDPDGEEMERLLGDLMGQVDDFFSQTLNHRTSMGVKNDMAQNVKAMNDDNLLNMHGVLSMDQDVDYVEAMIEYQAAQLVYQASIQVGNKLIQPTILDYL